jgi:hypothetical protein
LFVGPALQYRDTISHCKISQEWCILYTHTLCPCVELVRRLLVKFELAGVLCSFTFKNLLMAVTRVASLGGFSSLCIFYRALGASSLASAEGAFDDWLPLPVDSLHTVASLFLSSEAVDEDAGEQEMEAEILYFYPIGVDRRVQLKHVSFCKGLLDVTS